MWKCEMGTPHGVEKLRKPLQGGVIPLFTFPLSGFHLRKLDVETGESIQWLKCSKL